MGPSPASLLRAQYAEIFESLKAGEVSPCQVEVEVLRPATSADMASALRSGTHVPVGGCEESAPDGLDLKLTRPNLPSALFL